MTVYIAGGLELMTLGTCGLKRELIIDLETSALTPERGEIIRYRAVNRWDEDDLFDEWAKPLIPLPSDAELVLGVTNEELSTCRPTAAVMSDFVLFLEGAPFSLIFRTFSSNSMKTHRALNLPNR